MFTVPNKYRVGTAITVPDYHPFYDIIRRNSFPRSHPLEGAFFLPPQGKEKGLYFFCIASAGMGWEHVSISIPSQLRCPTWEEMCYVKSVFWGDEDAVMQLHPPKSDWVNQHPYCLHLWRPTGGSQIPLPPSILVGRKDRNVATNNQGR